MAKSFLRSGSLDDILALGENGQPVYVSAFQIREALRLKKQQHIADCLAIPQINEQGDRIDWYAPFEGKVIPWITASYAERKAAIKQLTVCLASANDISLRAQKSEKAAQRLLGVLLAKTRQFPDQNHVYLVAGKPVITFWGFVSQDKKTRSDPLDCLRQTAEEGVEPMSTTPPNLISTPTTVELPQQQLLQQPLSLQSPLLQSPPLQSNAPLAPVSAETELTKKPVRWLRLGWMLLIAALIIALIMQFSGGIPNNASPASEAAPSVVEKRVLPASNATAETAAYVVSEEKPVVIQSAITAPIIQPQLPLAQATVVLEAKIAEPVITSTTPANSHGLILPSDAVKIGSTTFLNGNWRVSPEIKNISTGKPPSLKYQIKNGKGTVKMTHGDNVTCRANVTAGLMKSGNLVINSRYRAQCSDGSKYQMPEIICKQGTSNIADCKGRYDANTTLSMAMKRENK